MYDMNNLTNFQSMDKSAASGMAAFWAFGKASFEAGSLSVRDKQVIAIGVALTTQRPYCVKLHVEEARKKEGATDQQLTETALVVAAIRSGGSPHPRNSPVQRQIDTATLLPPSGKVREPASAGSRREQVDFYPNVAIPTNGLSHRRWQFARGATPPIALTDPPIATLARSALVSRVHVKRRRRQLNTLCRNDALLLVNMRNAPAGPVAQDLWVATKGITAPHARDCVR